MNYLKGTFIFDVAGTIPELIFFNEGYRYYFLKMFRCLIHFERLVVPLEIIMKIILQKKSKKRQNDLITFCNLIMGVIYISHLMGCIWLYLGGQENCKLDQEKDYHCYNQVEGDDDSVFCLNVDDNCV
jgi:hypothetical protein